MITIFSYTLYLAYKFVINNKILTKKVTISKKKNIFIILALTYVIFFGIRSFFENSFGLFSIDYMLVVLSLFTLESKIFENS